MKMKVHLLLLTAVMTAGAFAQLRSPLLNNNRPMPGRPNVPGRAGAQQAQASAAPKPVSELMTKSTNGTCRLNMMDAEVSDVLNVYSEETGKTILSAPDLPKAKITLMSRDDLGKDDFLLALETVLVMNGVMLDPYGEKFVRAIPVKAGRQNGIPLVIGGVTNSLPDDGTVVSYMIKLKNIDTQEAQKALEGFKKPEGLFQVFERTNSILVTDTRQNVNRMLAILREIDVDTPVNENVFYYQVKYALANDIKSALETIVTESQKDAKGQQTAGPKLSGSPGFSRGNTATNGRTTLFNMNNRPGQQQPQQTAANETMTASISDADRGMIRGKVLILADERSNKLIIITSKPNYDFFVKVIETLDVETTPDVMVEVIRLKYADAEDVSGMLNDLIGNSASSSQKNSQNPVSSSAPASGSLTRPATTTAKAKAPANSNPGSKVGELNKDNVKVLADKRINGLVVMARKQDMPTVKAIINAMDVKLSQVLIETCIIEVTLGDDISTGIDWVQRGWNQDGTQRDGMVNHNNYMLGGGGGQTAASAMLGTMMSVGSNVVSSASWGGANPIGGGVNYLIKSDKLNLAAVVQASKTDSRSKYIASPVIMTVDNKEATVEATESRKFYSGSTSTSSYGSNPTTTYNYSDKDIGIKIKVTPKINPNGTVMLTVEEEYSQLGGGQSVLVSGQNGSPNKENIDTALSRKMAADVLLDNMQTVVLGGLTETYTSENETGVPILKDIPWIGKWLFGSVTQKESRKELLVFMTPYVLSDGDEAEIEAMRRKKALSDSRPWDDHGWSQSKLADPVSKKEQLRRQKDEWKNADAELVTKLAIEKAKLDRAKELRKLTKEEEKTWVALKKAIEEEEKKAREAEESMLDHAALDEFRQKKLSEAERDIKASEEKIKDGNEPAPDINALLIKDDEAKK